MCELLYLYSRVNNSDCESKHDKNSLLHVDVNWLKMVTLWQMPLYWLWEQSLQWWNKSYSVSGIFACTEHFLIQWLHSLCSNHLVVRQSLLSHQYFSQPNWPEYPSYFCNLHVAHCDATGNNSSTLLERTLCFFWHCTAQSLPTQQQFRFKIIQSLADQHFLLLCSLVTSFITNPVV